MEQSGIPVDGDPARQDQPKKTEDISSRVLKWLIFECVFVLLLFFVMIVILVVRGRNPEEQALPIQRKTVSGDMFHGDMTASTPPGIQKIETVRNILDGEVQIFVDGNENVSPLIARPVGKSPNTASAAGQPPNRDASAMISEKPHPGNDVASPDSEKKTEPETGRIDSVITTKTIKEYRGNVIVETVITTEEKGDTTFQTTVVTETKNGVVIRKTTTESTTTVSGGQSEQKPSGAN